MLVDGKLTRSTTALDVVAVLRERILGGYYAEDQFIRQALVAKELGVSRIPVREALAQLEAEGLVIREQYRGAVVPKLSSSEIEEIYALRGLLEPYLLEAAFDHITPVKLKHLQEIVGRVHSATDIAKWAELNVEFHRALYEPAGLPLALQTLDNLLVRADRYLKMQRSLSAQTKSESDIEHSRIIEFIKDGDKKGAISVLRKHIRWNSKDVRDAIGLKD